MRETALFLPPEIRSPSANGSHQARGDRRSLRLILGCLIGLIMSQLCIDFSTNNLNAQITNELAFDSLVMRFVAKEACTFDSISGFLTAGLKERLITDTSSKINLVVAAPVVEFKKIVKGLFQREMTFDLSLYDSLEHAQTLFMTDTLERTAISRVRKSKLQELRGNDPRWVNRILFPTAMIGTGIAGIFALFYVRSS